MIIITLSRLSKEMIESILNKDTSSFCLGPLALPIVISILGVVRDGLKVQSQRPPSLQRDVMRPEPTHARWNSQSRSSLLAYHMCFLGRSL